METQMLGKMLMHGMIAAFVIGAAAALFAQTQELHSHTVQSKLEKLTNHDITHHS
jgi:hypothetical protein